MNTLRALTVALPALLVACGSERTTAQPAPGCQPGQSCKPGPGPVIGPGGDAGGDASTDGGSADGGDAGVVVTATVRALNRYTDDASSAMTAPITNLGLRANRYGGGTVDVTMTDVEGRFVLNNVAPSTTAPTWVQLIRSGAIIGIAGIGATSSGSFALPLFSPELPLETWNTVAIGLGAYPSASNPSTIVVHVVDTAGARKQGVTAAPYGTAAGPYYDDGNTISADRKTTGARGTIVFLGVVGTPAFGLTLKVGTTTYETVNVPTAPNATTHLTLAVE